MTGIRKGIKWERVTGKQLGIGNREIEKINIRIKGKTKDVNIIRVYIGRPRKELSMNEWKELIKEVNNKEQWIIAGDFYVHNVL